MSLSKKHKRKEIKCYLVIAFNRRANGRPLQTKGPTTEKARLRMAEV